MCDNVSNGVTDFGAFRFNNNNNNNHNNNNNNNNNNNDNHNNIWKNKTFVPHSLYIKSYNMTKVSGRCNLCVEFLQFSPSFSVSGLEEMGVMVR